MLLGSVRGHICSAQYSVLKKFYYRLYVGASFTYVEEVFFFLLSFAPDHHSMAITRCQRQKQFVLVCFEESLSLLVLVDRANAESSLWVAYPIATNLVYLPDSFHPLVNFLRHKANSSTYYQNIIKRALIKFCSNFSEVFDTLCAIHFPTQRTVVDWCIIVIINDYMYEATNLLSGRLKVNCIYSANEAKRNWVFNQNLWLQREQYLQNNDYKAELNRSYAEFFEEVRRVMGCAPIRWHPINQMV